MSWPSNLTLPRSTPSRPATMRSKVVLPQPEGPSRETNSPLATPRLTPPSTAAAPKDFSAPATSRKLKRDPSPGWRRHVSVVSHRHVAVPALDPFAALLGDELPIEIVHLDVGGESQRRLGGAVRREGEGFRLQRVLQVGAQQHVDERQPHPLVGRPLDQADAGGTDEDAFLGRAHLHGRFLLLRDDV